MAGDYNLGTARGKIEVDNSGAVKAIKDTEKQSSSFTSKLQKAGSATAKAGAGIASVGAVIAAGFGFALSTAIGFEKQMSNVQAVSGATESQMESLRKKALQLGKDTSFSASEAGSAMEELVKAGISVEDVLNGAADATVALAAAGEVSLPEAATIASNAMNAFNLAAQDMPKVADAIAGAANASAIDVSQFGQSLQQVGAVANLVGLSFQDTAVAIAEMGNAGIKGSDAGTSLKTMLSNLQPQTKKQINLMKELGLVTADGNNKFFDAHGKLKSLRDIQKILNDSTKNLTAAQKQQALETIFGSDAIRAAAVLANNGATGFDKMAESMGKVTAESVALKRLDNTAGSIEQLKGSVETLAITVGQVLLPAFREIVDQITKLVNWFTNLSPSLQKAIIIFAAVTAAILLVVGGLIAFAGAIGIVLAALAPLAAAIGIGVGALLGILIVIPIIIAAIVALVIIIVKNWDTIKSFTVSVWNAIVAFLKSVWESVAAFFVSVGTSIASFFVGLWNTIKNAAIVAWNAIVSFLRTVFTLIVTIVTTFVNIILAPWRLMWSIFGGVITAAFQLIVAIIRLGMTLIAVIVLNSLRTMQFVWQTVWSIFVTVVQTVWNAIKAFISTSIATTVAIIRTQLAIIRAIFTTAWSAIVAFVRTSIATTRAIITTGVNAARAAVTAAWNTVKAITSAIWNAMPGVVRNAISGMLGVIRALPGQIKGIFAGAGTWLFNAGKEIIQGLLRGIESMIGAVTEKVNKLTGLIAKALPGSPVKAGPLKVLNRGYAGKQIAIMIADGIASGADILSRSMEAATAGLPSTLTFSATPTVIPGRPALPTDFPPPNGGTGAPGNGSNQLKLVKGTLSIDASGRAFITGVAEDVVSGDAEFDAQMARMR